MLIIVVARLIAQLPNKKGPEFPGLSINIKIELFNDYSLNSHLVI